MTPGISFKANVGVVKTSRAGGIQIVLDVFDVDKAEAARVMSEMIRENVQVALVPLPVPE